MSGSSVELMTHKLKIEKKMHGLWLLSPHVELARLYHEIGKKKVRLNDSY